MQKSFCGGGFVLFFFYFIFLFKNSWSTLHVEVGIIVDIAQNHAHILLKMENSNTEK